MCATEDATRSRRPVVVRRRQPPPLASSEHYRVKAVEQTLQILDVLAESPDLALPEIADRIAEVTAA